MRDFLSRFTPLDPAVSDALRVVEHFDALMARGVGLGGLLRAAAALAGAPAGAEVRGRVVVYAPDGQRLSGARGDRCAEVAFSDGSVWLEREGAPQVDDAIITSRLALAVATAEVDRRAVHPLEVLVDAESSAAQRAYALGRLGIDPAQPLRIVLSAARPPQQDWPISALLSTPSGLLHVSVDRWGVGGLEAPAGIGTWARADHAGESWEAALVAYRLQTESPQVVDAEELGAMLILARHYDPTVGHPDVTTIASLDTVSAEILRALVECDSLRSASTRLAMHHSTLQARHAALTETLGYDPRSTAGRMRYVAAEFLRRLGA